MEKRRLNIFQRIALESIWSLCWVIGRMPHFVQFSIIAPGLKFIIYRLLRYRRGVVDKNLRNSFPEMDESELSRVRSGFYTIFSEAIVSTFTLSHKKAYYNLYPKDAVELPNDVAALKKAVGDGSWIALAGHFGLWEYLGFWATYADQNIFAVYHPLENVVIDELMKRLRCQYKVEPIPSNESLRFIMRHGDQYNGKSYSLGLIADQSAPNRPQSYWHKFLGQDTIFFDGGEKLALKLKFPVMFVYQRRFAPGRYQMCYYPVWDGVEQVEPMEITSRYVSLLESVIREHPEMWLWSHKRWKAKRSKYANNTQGDVSGSR